MNEEQYLKERLNDQIDWYNAKAASNKKSFLLLSVLQFLAAALIPFLAPFISRLDAASLTLEISVGLLGVSVALITAVLGLYGFHQNWVQYRVTSETLQRERFLFLTRVKPYNGKDAFPLLVQRIESVLMEENLGWQVNREEKEAEAEAALEEGHDESGAEAAGEAESPAAAAHGEAHEGEGETAGEHPGASASAHGTTGHHSSG